MPTTKMPTRKKYAFPFEQGHYAFNELCNFETQWATTENKFTMFLVNKTLDWAEKVKNTPNSELKAADILTVFNQIKSLDQTEKFGDKINPNVVQTFTETCTHYIKEEKLELLAKVTLAKEWVHDHDLTSQPQSSQVTETGPAVNEVGKETKAFRNKMATMGPLSQRPVNTDQKLEDPDQRPVNTGPKP